MSNLIEGIPDGWELDGIRQAEPSEPILDDGGNVAFFGGKTKSRRVFPILKKIEKHKQYRPFANAAEFAPHKKRWLTHPENTVIGEFQVVEFNDNGIWCRGMDDLMPYKHAYKIGLRFDDRTPFGIEVINE